MSRLLLHVDGRVLRMNRCLERRAPRVDRHVLQVKRQIGIPVVPRADRGILQVNSRMNNRVLRANKRMQRVYKQVQRVYKRVLRSGKEYCERQDK